LSAAALPRIGIGSSSIDQQAEWTAAEQEMMRERRSVDADDFTPATSNAVLLVRLRFPNL